MNLARGARLILPPALFITTLAVQRTPPMGTGVRVLAAWSGPSNQPQAVDAGGGPDAGLDAGLDGGDAGPGPEALCGADDHLATPSMLGAGCC